jgi:hypothetical protein
MPRQRSVARLRHARYPALVRVLLLLAIAALSSTVAAGQPQTPVILRVGDARINTRALQPYKVRWKETFVSVVHEVVERGTRDDELRRDVIDGRDVLVRTIIARDPAGGVRESFRITVDAATFAPVRSEWKAGGASYEYEFAGMAITGTRVNEPGAKPVEIAAQVWQPMFDYYGGMTDLFLATLPRTPGMFTFPAATATTGAGATQDSIHWPLVEVVGEDVTRGAGGKLTKAWRVEANTPYGFFKVWVTDAAPHVVRAVQLMGPGGRVTFELLQ